MIGRVDTLRSALAGLALTLMPLAQAWGAGACHVVARNGPRLAPAAYTAPRLAGDEIRLTFVAHLGHLHHKLTPEHLAELGPIDVVLVPVDGSWTLRLDAMMEVLGEIRAPLMIPMHFFGPSTLERFLARAGEEGCEIARSDTPSVVLSRATLPGRPTVL